MEPNTFFSMCKSKKEERRKMNETEQAWRKDSTPYEFDRKDQLLFFWYFPEILGHFSFSLDKDAEINESWYFPGILGHFRGKYIDRLDD